MEISQGFAPVDDTTIEINANGEIALKDAGVSFDKLGTDFDKWELLETLTYTAEKTKTTSALKVCKEYMIRISNFHLSANTDLSLQINADTGANYGGIRINNVTVETYAGTNISLCSGGSLFPLSGTALIKGKTPPTNGGQISVVINAFGVYGAGCIYGLGGIWSGGNNIQVSTITLFTTQNATGTIEVYGR